MTPEPAPQVSTAPAEGGASTPTPLRRRRLPAHLGPARTSTVLLAVAFVLIGTLYLFVKPPERSDARPTGNDSSSTSRSSDPTTRAPATTAPTSPAPDTSEAPTTSEEPTPTEEEIPSEESPAERTEPPAETTTPEETAEPTEPAPTSEAPAS